MPVSALFSISLELNSRLGSQAALGAPSIKSWPRRYCEKHSPPAISVSNGRIWSDSTINFTRATWSTHQADEYRIEAKRLARALAAATSGASANIGRLSTGLTFSKPLSPATLSAGADAGDSSATPVANRAEEGSLPAGAASFTHGSLSRAIPPLSQLPRSWAEGCGRGAVEATGLSPNENVATWQPLATRRRSGEGFRPLQPSLAWEVGEGARVRESSDARGEAQLREMPRDTPFAHPATNGCFEGFALGSMAFPPSAIVRGGSARGAKRTSPSRRRHGRASARIRYRESPRGRGSTSPDRSYAHGGEV